LRDNFLEYLTLTAGMGLRRAKSICGPLRISTDLDEFWCARSVRGS